MTHILSFYSDGLAEKLAQASKKKRQQWRYLRQKQVIIPEKKII